ncbi:3-oxoacyl-ACP synthase [Parapedobacter sp. ISTM3]|uniref:Transcription elongation factor, GreA/GreB family n=1 Tax=Parapedobacter luteus TaxID=623280 RepID=A0A1T5B3Q1_9SPHI|nr:MULTISPECIES: hypothetical protein [Parapedobacter]MBK1440501.1 3-oxoacyl-ACP synthase [Parapedobacter sp. ISTM3]SKB41898.1 Transcription elongation factor, GreA/GreB family [Parapedobacter luteus]
MSANTVSQATKIALLDACKAYVDQRTANALQAIASASDAAADDTKSSAGDKFETTREMMQQELNRHQQLLTDAQRMAKVLADLDVRIHTEPVKLGSVVETNHGMFFIAVSVGQLQIDGTTYRVISSASPLGQRLIGLNAGEAITFNGTAYRVTHVC